MNSAKVDWPSVEAHAYELVSDKSTASDAYPAIRFIIAQLGERHTSLSSADAVRAEMTDQPVGSARPFRLTTPEGYVLSGNIGLITLKMEEGSPSDEAAYTQAAQTALKNFANRRVCRFIVDLRVNYGGNMYPMINGVAALLGMPPYGYWLDRDGKEGTAWTHLGETERKGDPLSADPVAVLIDRDTVSSGEFTAMAFEGRTNTRIFGEPSAGYLTVNGIHFLPDGARLAVSSGWAADRLHRPYQTTIVPDEATPRGQATVDAAIAWLGKQHCSG